MNDKTQDEFKRQLGGAAIIFYETRFNIIRNAFKADLKQKWDRTPYKKKVLFIDRQIKAGRMT